MSKGICNQVRSQGSFHFYSAAVKFHFHLHRQFQRCEILLTLTFGFGSQGDLH